MAHLLHRLYGVDVPANALITHNHTLMMNV